MQAKFEEISDQLELTTNQNEELVLRLEGLENTVKSYTGEKESVHKRLVELTNLLHSRSVEAEAEKAQLRKQIDKITADIKLTEEISYPWNLGTQITKVGPKGDAEDRDYSSINPIESRRGQNILSNEQIDDMLIRMKTTNPNSEKFADTVEIIY